MFGSESEFADRSNEFRAAHQPNLRTSEVSDDDARTLIESTLPAAPNDDFAARVTESERAAIANSRAAFRVTVLRGVIEGKDRLVYLGGECHVKSSVAAERAIEFVQLFEYTAVEGVPSNTFGDKFTNAAFFPLQMVHALAKKISRNHIQGSTIGQIIRAAKSNDSLEKVLYLEQSDVTTGLREVSKIVLGACLWTVCAAATLGYASMLIPSSELLSDAFATSMLTTKIAGTYMAGSLISGALFPHVFQNQKTLHYLLLPAYDLIVGRNNSMIQTLVEHLKAHAEISKILTVVGNAHRKELAAILTHKYGFEAIE